MVTLEITKEALVITGSILDSAFLLVQIQDKLLDIKLKKLRLQNEQKGEEH